MIPVPPSSRTRLEICVDTPDGLAIAIAAGADRIELCSSLDVGGLTPSPGLIALASDSPVPVYAMIRPRQGDFVYGTQDLAAMRADITAVRRAGLAGVVIGASRPNHSLDEQTLADLCAEAGTLGRTLHRAFDLTPSKSVALELAVALGFERILTSGGASDAPSGSDGLAALVIQARGRIAIMAGGGIRPENLTALVHRTGVAEVHASGKVVALPPPDIVRWGFAGDRCFATSFDAIRALRAALP
ncbi:copper homeostasis protein CutC [Lichenifustis flavocetrariae]|uniref:PF03932 family protein CutC n=1 Tax=Lichenifustis flavocetrariae TaxID=2949735 RepID=A0AA41YV62_9HYPH|nr:copper homeostasis protein CutC [Lichenifustis flavocetrariae]MCW6509156.1 copper homeostasis protein CutC [Lichenifustis flavocetrariae]